MSVMLYTDQPEEERLSTVCTRHPSYPSVASARRRTKLDVLKPLELSQEDTAQTRQPVSVQTERRRAWKTVIGVRLDLKCAALLKTGYSSRSA